MRVMYHYPLDHEFYSAQFHANMPFGIDRDFDYYRQVGWHEATWRMPDQSQPHMPEFLMEPGIQSMSAACPVPMPPH